MPVASGESRDRRHAASAINGVNAKQKTGVVARGRIRREKREKGRREEEGKKGKRKGRKGGKEGKKEEGEEGKKEREMLPYQMAMDYGGFQRQSPVGVGVGVGVDVGGPHQGAAGALNINPAFTHSWFVPTDLCVPYKQSQGPLLEPGHVVSLILIFLTILMVHL